MLVRTALVLLSWTALAAAQTAPTPTPAHGTHTPPKPVTAGSRTPTAILHTTAGDMKCELFPDQAPNAVANLIGLATGTKAWKDPVTGKMIHEKPLYDGVIFHRTIPGFMIQTGDPTGTGSGNVGFDFADELHADLLYDKPGRLGMANHGRNTNSSQFFITEVAYPSLNPCLDEGGCQKPYGHIDQGTGYTIFGQCDDAAVEVVKKIARMPCQAGLTCSDRNSRPQNPVKISHIEILNAPAAAKTAPAKPAAGTPAKPKPSPKP
jgi:peptidyl-prolyl cis-trans isomerase A (cyclophilin A)